MKEGLLTQPSVLLTGDERKSNGPFVFLSCSSQGQNHAQGEIQAEQRSTLGIQYVHGAEWFYTATLPGEQDIHSRVCGGWIEEQQFISHCGCDLHFENKHQMPFNPTWEQKCLQPDTEHYFYLSHTYRGEKKKKKKSYHLTSEEYIYWLNEEKQKKLRFTFHVGAHFGKLYKHQGSYSSLDVWADGDIYFISGFDIKKQQFQIHARIISWKQLYTSPKKKQIGLVSSQSDFMYKTGRHCRNGCTLKYLLL